MWWRGEGAVKVLHPKEELGVVADVERVRYEVFRGGVEVEGVQQPDVHHSAPIPTNVEDPQNKTPLELKCRVWVGERMVAEVGNGTSTIEVETRAAEEAINILKSCSSPS